MFTTFEEAVIVAFKQLDYNLLKECQQSACWNWNTVCTLRIGDYFLLGYSIVQCKSYADCEFVFRCLTEMKWPETYICNLSCMYDTIESEQQLLQTYFVLHCLQASDPVEIKEYKLYIIQTLVQEGYPLSYLELACCLRNDVNGFVLQSLLPTIDPETLGTNNDAHHFVQMILGPLIEANQLEQTYYFLRKCSEHDIYFEPSCFHSFHNWNLNQFVSQLYEEYRQKEGHSYDDGDDNDDEDEKNMDRYKRRGM